MWKPNLSNLSRLVILAVVLSASGPVGAHAVVTESSLKTEAIPAHRATKVQLFFNSGIELALSQVFLVSKGDKQEKLEISAGRKPGQVIIAIPPLVNGEYALRYKVFAADGHLTEDIIRFTVSE